MLVPARNEAQTIAECVASLARHGNGIHIVVIDDQSNDGTGALARAAVAPIPDATIEVIAGDAPPAGWGGKLWALQQGLDVIDRRYCLLLDADIALAPNLIPALLATAEQEAAAMVSVMAKLNCTTFWEHVLIPPFIFFFKLLYPFALVAQRESSVAAAAGGCILIETAVLKKAGAFAAYRDALIDDCTLAARVKKSGYGIRLFLSDDVTSIRAYPGIAPIWHMVARTAYTQLQYSPVLLLLTTAIMAAVFIAPVWALSGAAGILAAAVGGVALALMLYDFSPVSRFYGHSLLWRATLPMAALLYLAMTWHSAINYYTGTRAVWKARRYESQIDH